MLKLLVMLMSPANVREGAINLCILLIPMNATSALINWVAFGTTGFAWTELLVVTTFTGIPFMIGGQYIGARQRSLHEKLTELARTDPLTRLPNRRAFMEEARLALSKQSGAILLVDADHFKKINDNYGHAAGDQCLQSLAMHLEGLVRRDDIIGRVGGEEFAIFLRDADPKDAAIVGERISEGTVIPLDNGHPLHLTTSVGMVAASPSMTLDEALRDADIALYRAKENGRARIEVAA